MTELEQSYEYVIVMTLTSCYIIKSYHDTVLLNGCLNWQNISNITCYIQSPSAHSIADSFKLLAVTKEVKHTYLREGEREEPSREHLLAVEGLM